MTRTGAKILLVVLVCLFGTGAFVMQRARMTMADSSADWNTSWPEGTLVYTKNDNKFFVQEGGSFVETAAPLGATYITQTADSSLTAEQALSSLSTGVMKVTNGTGVVSTAAEGTDYYKPGGTDVAVADGGTGKSTAYEAFDALTATGSNIASASTVDLDAATGCTITITGTTTITAITLSDGRFRIVRFSGALTLTHGSSLVLPGAANITTVNGDYAMFCGFGAGVVRCINYSRTSVTGTGSTVLSNTPTLTTPVIGAATGTSLAVTGVVTSSGATNGIGYASGAGGTVTQATSKSTGVTINKICGAITTHNATLNAGVEVQFTVTNSAVAATDSIVLSLASGGTANTYLLSVHAVAAGSFAIIISNASGTNRGEALVINFAVIKGVTS